MHSHASSILFTHLGIYGNHYNSLVDSKVQITPDKIKESPCIQNVTDAKLADLGLLSSTAKETEFPGYWLPDERNSIVIDGPLLQQHMRILMEKGQVE